MMLLLVVFGIGVDVGVVVVVVGVVRDRIAVVCPGGGGVVAADVFATVTHYGTTCCVDVYGGVVMYGGIVVDVAVATYDVVVIGVAVYNGSVVGVYVAVGGGVVGMRVIIMGGGRMVSVGVDGCVDICVGGVVVVGGSCGIVCCVISMAGADVGVVVDTVVVVGVVVSAGWYVCYW